MLWLMFPNVHAMLFRIASLIQLTKPLMLLFPSFSTCLVLLSTYVARVHGEEGETNVALGAVCYASTIFSSKYKCERAVDGVTSTDFATRKQGVGLWLKLQFNQMYLINRIRIMDRHYRQDKNKEVEMKFTDGSTQSVTLGDFGDGLHWNSFNLDPVVTYDVLLTVLSVYASNNNGFREFQIFGVPAPLTYSIGQGCPAWVTSSDHQEEDWWKRVTGSLEPANHMPWDLFYKNRMCFSNCIQTPECIAVVVNIANDRCMVVTASFLMPKILQNNDHIIWRPDR